MAIGPFSIDIPLLIKSITLTVMLAGLLVLPLLPGLVIIWVAALGYGLVAGFGTLGWIMFAFLTVFTRDVLRTHGVWTMAIYSIGFASLFWLIVNPPWRVVAGITGADLLLPLVLLAVVSLLIPHSLYFSGLRRVAPSRAIITSTLEPVVAITSAALFLGEYLQPLQILGAVVVLGAIVLLQFHPEEHHAA